MSISSINSNNQLYQTLYQTQNSALNSLATPSSTSSQSTQGTQAASSFTQMLQTLGTDLQSGNLQSAQQDFTQLQQLLQGIGSNQNGSQTQVHHHRHHHSDSSAANSYQANAGGLTTQGISSTSQGQTSSTTA